MMDTFNKSKYTRWYWSIVTYANATNKKGVGYLEKHHVIPKSMGGKNTPENLVLLTARQHFVCHLLLTKMVKGPNIRKAWMALRAMAMMDASPSQARKAEIVVSSRMFEQLRVVNGLPNSYEVLMKKRAAYARRGPHKPETIEKMRATYARKNGVARKYLPPKPKRWSITSPNGDITSCTMLEDFCREKQLHYPSLRVSDGAPVPPLQRVTSLTNPLRENTVGWSARK